MTLISKTVGNEIFLQGKYLSIGVNSSGDIGTRQSAPDGIHHDLTYARVGLLADLDGFGTGKEALRDAVVRGAPIEGFNIGYKIAGKTYVQSNQEMDGLTEIAGKSSNASTARVAEADWKGSTTEKLGIDQKITLTDDAKYVRFEVVLTNNSSASMADLHYMRTVDPDLGDGFSTVNTILKQGEGGSLITAAATSSSSPMFLYTTDDRAVVSSYGFINEDPFAAAVSVAQKVGAVTKTDTSINLNFTLGNLGAGQSTTVVFYMGVTDNLKATIAEIDALGETSGGRPTTPTPPVPEPVNAAPVATNDTLKIVSGATGTGNVLANDTDGDKDALTASLKTGPAHGTVTLAADGSYTYKAAAGYTGSDSFTYTASDGKDTSAATVALTVKAAPPAVPGLPLSDLLQRAGTLDGTASTANKLTGIAGHNTFYFDHAATSGNDTITNFERSDVLVLKGMLADNNGDGIIAFSKSKLSLGGTDKVTLTGVSALRYLGTDEMGLSVYANSAVKPKGAIEGTIGDDSLSGATAAKKSVFFFDTALDLHLGHDGITNFDSNDLLVTTTALQTTKLDGTGAITLTGASGELGTVDFHDAASGGLEFDGSVVHSGVTYYVYSQVGSSVGHADLAF